jgi:hypothetical protein
VVVETEAEPGRFMEMRSYNADADTVTVLHCWLARRAEDHYNPASRFQVVKVVEQKAIIRVMMSCCAPFQLPQYRTCIA